MTCNLGFIILLPSRTIDGCYAEDIADSDIEDFKS